MTIDLRTGAVDRLFWTTDGRLQFLAFAFALLARLLAWPFSDVVDADAVTRALSGESYMRYAGWSGDGMWPPLHIYLNGLATVLCGSRVVGPVLLNIVLASALAFPVFAFVRRWGGTTAAFCTALLIVFNPLVFRNSLQGLAEVPFLFFTACAINALDRAMSDDGRAGGRRAVLAGIYMTVASGMRYEAWALIPVLAMFPVLAGRWRRSFYFVLPAVVFPVAWMVTCHYAHGNMLRGVEHVMPWYVNETVLVHDAERELRTWFFPVSFVLACQPIVVLAGAIGAAWMVITRRLTPHQWPWLTLFPLFLLLMVVKARNAELLTQHRFTMTPVLLFVPFLCAGFSLLRPRKVTSVVIVFVCAWGSLSTFRAGGPTWLTRTASSSRTLWFIREHTLHELRAVPRLQYRRADLLVKAIDAVPASRKLLVLDFFGWEDTYNVALRVDVISTSVVFLPSEATGSKPGMDGLQRYFDLLHDPQGVLAVGEGGPYAAAMTPTGSGTALLPLPHVDMVLTPMGRVAGIELFRFNIRKR